jgi:hypothetical protein
MPPKPPNRLPSAPPPQQISLELLANRARNERLQSSIRDLTTQNETLAKLIEEQDSNQISRMPSRKASELGNEGDSRSTRSKVMQMRGSTRTSLKKILTSLAPPYHFNHLPGLPGPKIPEISFFAPGRKQDSREAQGGNKEVRVTIEARTKSPFFQGDPGGNFCFC